MADEQNVGLPSDQLKEPQQNAPLVPGTPEYDQAMIAKVEKNSPQVAQRPDHVPEKFWDAEKGLVRTEDLLKSYQELERFKKPTDEQKVETPPADQKAEPNADAARDTVESKGLSFDKFSSEFAEKGALSEDSYKALQASGIPPEMVNGYIEGQKALAAQRDAQGYELAGGKDAFSRMAEWAKGSMQADELVALNKQFAGSEAEMKLAVTSLRARYEAANGKQPQLLGGSPSNTNTQGYDSRAQMVADMKDPRYSTDPAYRARVEAKLGVTTAF